MLKQVLNLRSLSSSECCINKIHIVTPYPARNAEWRWWRHAGSPQPGYWHGRDNADAESLALKEPYLSVGLPTPPAARPFLHPLSPAVVPYAGVNKLWHLTQYPHNFCLQWLWNLINACSGLRWVPGSLSLGVKLPGREADIYLVSRWKMVELYLHSPLRLYSILLD
jgi:hypothetical protein